MSQLRSSTVCCSVLLLVAGCKEQYEMVTAAHDSVSVSDPTLTDTGTATETTTETGGSTAQVPTTSQGTTEQGGTEGMSGSQSTSSASSASTTGMTSQTATTEWDPTATTGAPVACEAPEDCTGEGSGDLAAFVLPFFRGEVCTADKLRPGDMLPISWNPCVHPCIDPQKYSWRWIVRCDGGVGCEIAFMQYYREATGSNCPSDVFGKFNSDKCKYIGPHLGLTEGLMSFGYPEDKLLVPFITNEDAAAVSELEPSAMVWARIDGHVQGADRYFPLSVSMDNPAPPTECGPGVPGCTCKEIGF